MNKVKFSFIGGDITIPQLPAVSGNVGALVVPLANVASLDASQTPALNFQSDWNNADSTDQRFIANKPVIPSVLYKVYTAILGSNLSPVQLQNTIGDGSGNGSTDIAWSNPSNGVLHATMSTGTPFVTGKVFIILSNINNGGNPFFFLGFAVTQNLLVFNLIKYDGTMTGTPTFSNAFVEIRVYN